MRSEPSTSGRLFPLTPEGLRAFAGRPSLREWLRLGRLFAGLMGIAAATAVWAQPTNLPALPEVERSAAAQPQVGLASDTHLNKTPPRETKGLDLVKLGWTYNCMECHKLLKARWTYDRPMVEHAEIQLQHGNSCCSAPSVMARSIAIGRPVCMGARTAIGNRKWAKAPSCVASSVMIRITRPSSP